MKLLCDRMLGSLAKWLRIFGFDTYYAKEGVEDQKLIEIAKEEKRILITRDKELIYDAKRENLKVIDIKSRDLGEQLQKTLTKIKIDPKKYLTRCLVCNSLIEEIEKEKVRNKVPGQVFENNDKFWFCKKCEKIYWNGTHYENMLSKIKQTKN